MNLYQIQTTLCQFVTKALDVEKSRLALFEQSQTKAQSSTVLDYYSLSSLPYETVQLLKSD
jgi:hypothetical protein